LKNSVKYDSYAFALFESKIYLVQFLAMYRQSSNYHSYVDTVTYIDSLSYISVRVYENQASNIFECISEAESRYILFLHIPNHLIIYYLENSESCIKNIGFMIIGKKEMKIYNFFNSIIDKLQLILMNK